MNLSGLMCQKFGLPYCGSHGTACGGECALYVRTTKCNVGQTDECIFHKNIGGYHVCTRGKPEFLSANHTGCYGGWKRRTSEPFRAVLPADVCPRCRKRIENPIRVNGEWMCYECFGRLINEEDDKR